MKNWNIISGEVRTDGSGRPSVVCLFLLVFLLSSFFSCMKEDLSDCPEVVPANVYLHIIYTDSEGNKLPLSSIGTTSLFLFDSDSTLYTHIQLTEEDLTNEGTSLYVEPGDYYVMAWGNPSSGFLTTITENGIHFEQSYLTYLPEQAGAPLYYAPDKRLTGTDDMDMRSADYENYLLQVPAEGIAEHTLPFVSAYHTVNVYIRGVHEDTGTIRSRMDHVPAGYSFHLMPLDEVITFEQTTEWEDGMVRSGEAGHYRAAFYIPHFDHDTEMEVSIYTDDGSLEARVLLAEFLEKEGIELADGDCRQIDILFEYAGDVLVGITFPSWKEENVEGGFKE